MFYLRKLINIFLIILLVYDLGPRAIASLGFTIGWCVVIGLTNTTRCVTLRMLWEVLPPPACTNVHGVDEHRLPIILTKTKWYLS